MDVLRKNKGNIGDIATSGVCILAMSAVMVMYFQCAGLIQMKNQAGQLARRYMLVMETVGCLLPEDYLRLEGELTALGVSDLSFEGTTFSPAGYGQPLVLEIRGKIKGEYDFYEYRTSTAKY